MSEPCGDWPSPVTSKFWNNLDDVFVPEQVLASAASCPLLSTPNELSFDPVRFDINTPLALEDIDSGSPKQESNGKEQAAKKTSSGGGKKPKHLTRAADGRFAKKDNKINRAMSSSSKRGGAKLVRDHRGRFINPDKKADAASKPEEEVPAPTSGATSNQLSLEIPAAEPDGNDLARDWPSFDLYKPENRPWPLLEGNPMLNEAFPLQSWGSDQFLYNGGYHSPLRAGLEAGLPGNSDNISSSSDDLVDNRDSRYSSPAEVSSNFFLSL
eukprot:scaffold391799_cov43-Prasinocladus_malaysianus.AAC.1